MQYKSGFSELDWIASLTHSLPHTVQHFQEGSIIIIIICTSAASSQMEVWTKVALVFLQSEAVGVASHYALEQQQSTMWKAFLLCTENETT